MALQKVSIITGIMHCGTTLVLDLLKANPEIYADFEIGILNAQALNKDGFTHWCQTEAHPGMLRNQFGITQDEIINLHDSRNWSEVYGRLYDLMCKKDPAGTINRTHLIDKTPSYASNLARTMARMPDVQYVGVIRDPRAVYASWMKRSDRRVTPAEFMRVYNPAMAALMRANGKTSQVYLLRFEHLITTPQRQVPMLCAHLDITYRPEMCDPRNAFRQHHKTRDNFVAHGNTATRRVVTESGMDLRMIDEYKTLLSQSDRDTIIRHLDPALSWTLYKG